MEDIILFLFDNPLLLIAFMLSGILSFILVITLIEIIYKFFEIIIYEFFKNK